MGDGCGTGGGMILLVEDNPDDAELTVRSLRRSGITNEIVLARDGSEALDLFFGKGGKLAEANPLIVLLDLKLPKVDGFEVLRRLRAEPRTKLMPVVILTSSVEERDLAEGYGLGANSYIRKPVDSAKFEETVRGIGLYWLLLNSAGK